MKQFVCDRCRASIEDTEDGRREWTCVRLCKIESPAAFEVSDLCQPCTSAIRRFLSGAKETYVSDP